MKQYILDLISQKWRALAVILVLILLNVILGIVVAVYQLPDVADLQTRWANLRQKSAVAGQLDAAALYRQGTQDLESLKTRIPEKREYARVLSDLYESAASSNVEIGALSYKPVQIKDEGLYSYKLALSASGSYAAVKSYLADLQNYNELLVVDSVSFVNSDLYVENVVMNLNLTLYLRGGA